MGLADLWGKIEKSKTYRPARVIIPPENIFPKLKIPGPFARHKQYFEVTVNQMYLTYNRQWFKTWEPVVFVATRFLYDGNYQEVPFVVGEKMMEGKINTPQGMIFENTKVAGLHPYRGGNFSITVVLCRALQNNYLKKVLNLIEDASKTYLGGFGTSVLPYVKIAKVVLDSYEDLVDSRDVEPLIGRRITFNPDTEEGFNPGYFALINEPEEETDPSEFYVINGNLHLGKSKESAEPYRKDDYVLYSILAANQRSDVEVLPYYEHFKKIQDQISGMGVTIGDDRMDLINGRLFSLLDLVRMSPDLTREQVDIQIQDFRQELRKMIDARRPLAGDKQTDKDDRDDWEKNLDNELLSILTRNRQ
jgi:hypothetical protein